MGTLLYGSNTTQEYADKELANVRFLLNALESTDEDQDDDAVQRAVTFIRRCGLPAEERPSLRFASKNTQKAVFQAGSPTPGE